MINLLKAAVISICFTAIAVGIIESLIPDDSYKPQLRLLTGAVLSLSLILPLTRMPKIELPELSAQNVTVSVNEQLSRAAAASAKEDIEAFLRQFGIDKAKISVFTDIGADNCIVINKACLAVAAADIEKASSAARAAENTLGYDVEVEELPPESDEEKGRSNA